ncbi:MAG TPA: CoA-transferase [Desulfobacterales bacterium]|nr:CoA-transferase [Desulfobacterales bacterium]
MSANIDLKDKLMSAEEAVRRFVKDGDMIALGGFTVNRNAMVIAREIIRQGRRDLHLVMHSHGQAMDILVGAGSVSRLELAYGGTGRFAPTGIRFRKAVQSGQVQVEDYSNFHMSLRFLAGALNLPFIPSCSGFESDVLNRQGFGPEVRGRGQIPSHKAIVTDNPFSPDREPVVLLPALTPDVALMHAQFVGTDGTVRIKGLTFLDIEQAKAASCVIVTCEEVVPSAFLRQDPDQNSLPPFLVDAVVPAPFGAHPTACLNFYDYDPRHLNMYRQMAGNDEDFRKYLKEWVYEVADQEAYLAKVGVSDLMRIKANSSVGYAPGLDRR